MPSGIDAFRRKQQAKEQQKAQYGGTSDGPNVEYFSLRANQYAIVRFLEQGDDIYFADSHRVPVQGRTKRYFRDFICLDVYDDGTPCPACQSSDAEIAKRGTRGYLNVIWREGPVFKMSEKGFPEKDSQGNNIIVGREDGIFLWKCSWTVLEMLREKDSKYKGLMSRDWEIKRTGSQMNDTVYHIDPANPETGASPMLITDLMLVEKKFNLTELTRPMSYQDLAQILNRGAMPPGQGPQPTMDRSAVLPTADSTFNQSGGAQEPMVRASAFTRG